MLAGAPRPLPSNKFISLINFVTICQRGLPALRSHMAERYNVRNSHQRIENIRYVKDVFKAYCRTNQYKNYINILIVYFRTLPEKKNKRRFTDNFPADDGCYRKKIDAYRDKSARTFP